MRYYAGNWATSHWLFRKDTGAEEKFDSTLVKSAPVVVKQLTKLYDADRPSSSCTRRGRSGRCTRTGAR